MKKLIGASLLAAAIMSPLAVAPAVHAGSQPNLNIRECDHFAVMYCGAYSKSELLSKIKHGDTKHSAANMEHVYYKENRGITEAGINRAEEGRLYKNGDIYVGDTKVATAAVTTGRDWEAGSKKDGSLYRRAKITFIANVPYLKAYVNRDGGQFRWAILLSCGNIVTAKPVKPTPVPVTPHPDTPSPSPKTPSPSPKTPSPSPKTPTPSPYVTPSASPFVTPSPAPCVSPSATPTVSPTPYVTPSASVCPTPPATPSPTPVVTPTPTPTVTPTSTPTPTPKQMPDTGAGDLGALGGATGVTAIGYAATAYVRSRRDLLAALRCK